MLNVKTVILLTVLVLLALSCSKKDIKPTYTDPKDTYASALKLIDNKEYEEGRKLLTEITNRGSATDYAPEAQLKIAESYTREDETELAVTEYRKFIRLYPGNKYAPYAQYMIATLTFNQIEGADRGFRAAEDAIKEFNKLTEMFPRNPYREIIALRIQKCRNILAEHEFYVGSFYLKKEAFKAAVERFNVVLKKYPDFSNMPGLYYNLALANLGLKDIPLAKEYFQKVLETATDKKILKNARTKLNSLN
ncbi:MAG: outer membrane protein assembly factor BamD [Nitrospirae bacterium]|nr:outer membrane protein assembly factor BamD [Nitrospirota bacterium]MBF0536333.1 outer membrane protein assembly factor BamD [Nitrospirota bacterium]MBF0618274.1 outer membrane protein assembly factor BamD [Nitrospirota bacterium]